MFTGWSDSKPVDAVLRGAVETFPVMHSIGGMLQTEVVSLSTRTFKTQTVRSDEDVPFRVDFAKNSSDQRSNYHRKFTVARN